jgi:hypothetical protein
MTAGLMCKTASVRAGDGADVCACAELDKDDDVVLPPPEVDDSADLVRGS